MLCAAVTTYVRLPNDAKSAPELHKSSGLSRKSIEASSIEKKLQVFFTAELIESAVAVKSDIHTFTFVLKSVIRGRNRCFDLSLLETCQVQLRVGP